MEYVKDLFISILCDYLLKCLQWKKQLKRFPYFHFSYCLHMKDYSFQFI